MFFIFSFESTNFHIESSFALAGTDDDGIVDDSEDDIIVVAVLLLNLSIGEEGVKDNAPIARVAITNSLIIFMVMKLSNVAKPTALVL